MVVSKNWNGALRIHEDIRKLFPDIVIGYLVGDIRNSGGHPGLWKLILERSAEISRSMDEESIRKVPGIQAGKQAYRQLGKDPNRYRLSAESLMRRVVKGKDLYPISTAVDALNLVSLTTGITIGGFDALQVCGEVELGIGYQGEEFIAIGRGPLNVGNLPVYRDESGAIGNPTSDCERTRITLSTKQILMLITGFYGIEGIMETQDHLKKVLIEYCECKNCKTGIV